MDRSGETYGFENSYIDCKTVLIFAYSSTSAHSNKRPVRLAHFARARLLLQSNSYIKWRMITIWSIFARNTVSSPSSIRGILMTFSWGLLQEIKKMCRDTLLVYLLLHLAVWGLFRPKKNIVLVPCSALYPCLGTPSLSARGRRGGGEILWPIRRRSARINGCLFQASGIWKGRNFTSCGTFVISVFEGLKP